MPLIVMTGPNTFQYYEDGRPGTTGNVDVVSQEEATALGFEPGDMYHRDDPRNKRNRVATASTEGGGTAETAVAGGDTQQIAGVTIGEDGIQGATKSGGGGAAGGGGGGLVPGMGMGGGTGDGSAPTADGTLAGFSQIGQQGVGQTPVAVGAGAFQEEQAYLPSISKDGQNQAFLPSVSNQPGGAAGVGPNVSIPQGSYQDRPNWRQPSSLVTAPATTLQDAVGGGFAAAGRGIASAANTAAPMPGGDVPPEAMSMARQRGALSPVNVPSVTDSSFMGGAGGSYQAPQNLPPGMNLPGPTADYSLPSFGTGFDQQSTLPPSRPGQQPVRLRGDDANAQAFGPYQPWLYRPEFNR